MFTYYFDLLLQYFLDNNFINPTYTISSPELRTWLLILIINTTLANTASFCGFFLGLLAPYGSESKQPSKIPSWMWGPKINSKLGWYIMEIPALMVAVLSITFYDIQDFITAPNHCQLAIGLFISHYINRGIVFPAKRGSSNSMESSSTFILGAIFNSGNAYCICRYLTKFGRDSILDETTNVRIVLACLVFFTGAGINMMSDELLLQFSKKKKQEKDADVKKAMVPGGFVVFEYVTAANYFGELMEWFGFFLLTYPSPASACFVYMTFCNLAPRAWNRHQRYIRDVPGYKELNRRAIVPFLL